MSKESHLLIDPEGKYKIPTVIDYAAKGNDTNYPLIITGDAGCGKTHLIIKWLMRFNEKQEDSDCDSCEDDKPKNDKPD